MKNTKVVLSILYLFFLVVLLSCDMDRFEAVEIEDIPIQAYTKIKLGDLEAFTPAVSTNEDISEWPANSLERECGMLIDGYSIVLDLADILMEDKNNFSYKPFAFSSHGIVSSFLLQVSDKNLTCVDPLSSPISVHCTIEYMNLLLESHGNPFKNMLALAAFDNDFIDLVLANNGTLHVSGKIRNTTLDMASVDENEHISVASIAANLKITGSKSSGKGPTGFLSGNIKFSIASSSVYEENVFGRIQYNSPVVLQVEVSPFSEVSMQSIITAVENEYNAAEGEKRDPNYWSIIKPIMWGSANGDFLQVTRIIGAYDASTIEKTDTWTNADACNLISSIFY